MACWADNTLGKNRRRRARHFRLDEVLYSKVTLALQWNYRRPGVRKIQAVPSTTHGMLKFPIEGGVLTLWSSKIISLECAMVSEPTEETPATDPPAEKKSKSQFTRNTRSKQWQ